jgi:hypothetical protein
VTGARPIRPEQTDIAWRVRALADAGIACQILRLQNVSGVDALEPAEGLEIPAFQIHGFHPPDY